MAAGEGSCAFIAKVELSMIDSETKFPLPHSIITLLWTMYDNPIRIGIRLLVNPNCPALALLDGYPMETHPISIAMGIPFPGISTVIRSQYAKWISFTTILVSIPGTANGPSFVFIDEEKLPNWVSKRRRAWIYTLARILPFPCLPSIRCVINNRSIT